MKQEELNKPIYTIKKTAEIMGVNDRTVVRMLEDGRLEGELVDTLRGKIWLISPISIAMMVVKKDESGNKRYPKAKK